MRANHLTPEEVAEGYRLPVEAVLEAMDYYEKNKDIVDADTAEEIRALQEAGLLKDCCHHSPSTLMTVPTITCLLPF